MEASSKGTTCTPVRDLIGNDIEAAYAVQSTVTTFRESQGASVVGCKVGLTSRVVQEQFGVHQPDFGLLFDDMVHEHGAELPLDKFLQPRIEAEVAFVLGYDLDRSRPSVADLIRATAFVLPALEIVDSRITNWDLTISDTIADNASSGAVVLGVVPTSLDRLDLSQIGMSLLQDGEEVSDGSGENCMGSPVVAATWVARQLAQKGRPLRAGDIVMSGALGAMVDVRAASAFTAQLDQLGDVDVTFAER